MFLEPLNRYEDHMVNRLDQGAAVCRAVGLDAVKLVADTYHMNIEEDHPADSVRVADGLIGHVQLGDSARWQPGTGHVDFADAVGALHDIGFDGWLALECNPRRPDWTRWRRARRCSPAARTGAVVKLGCSSPCTTTGRSDALDRAVALGLEAVEIATGNYPGDAHCRPAELLDDSALDDFRRAVERRGLEISALSQQGNPLHPDPAVAGAAHETWRRRCASLRNSASESSTPSPVAPAITTEHGDRTG